MRKLNKHCDFKVRSYRVWADFTATAFEAYFVIKNSRGKIITDTTVWMHLNETLGDRAETIIAKKKRKVA